MNFGEKLDVLIRRKGWKKTDFADKIGVTYRALANYSAGSRTPRGEILKKIALLLDTNEEFLLDDRQNLILSSEERFFQYASEKSTGLSDAASLISQAKDVFTGPALADEDKQALFSLLTEIYFDAKRCKKEKV